MRRKLLILSLLSVFCSSINAQEIQNRISIKNDTIILNQDSLFIGKTILSDYLTNSQIDSLGEPIISHWDGDCDSGTDYEYWVNKNNYKTVFVKDSKGKYILKTILLKNISKLSLSIGNQVIEDKILQKDILHLGFIKEEGYKRYENETTYRKDGIYLRCHENSDSISIQSIQIRPKSWEQKLEQKIVKGEIENTEGESLPGVLFLAYNQSDTLKYYGVTGIDGRYFLDTDNVTAIDIFNFNYEPQTIKILDNNDQTINLKLKKKTYYLPDLIITRKGEIEFDSICYLEQFPKVRDSSKLNVWLMCEFTNFNPLIYSLPSAIGGLKHSYEKLGSNLFRSQKLRRCTAKVNLVIYKNGLIQLQNVVCDDKINKELLARCIFEVFKWTPARWRGRPINSDWSMKIIFE